MNETKQFIEILLERASDFDDGILIPNEVELKLNELVNFNIMIAQQLSEVEQVILIEKNFFNNEITKTQKYSVKLIKFSLENDSISFYPVALKNYLKTFK